MIELLVIAEGRDDQEIACGLAERVLNESEPSIAEHRWRGLDASHARSDWRFVKSYAAAKRISVLRRKHDTAYVEAAKAIAVAQHFHRHEKEIAAVAIHRDIGDSHNRAEQFPQAREDSHTEFAVLMALPNRETEAWLLNGFEPATSAERKLLKDKRSELKFCPCAQAHTLGGRGDARDPKTVLKQLTRNKKRATACWQQTPLTTLKENGQHSGLTEWLDEVESRLLPRLS